MVNAGQQASPRNILGLCLEGMFVLSNLVSSGYGYSRMFHTPRGITFFAPFAVLLLTIRMDLGLHVRYQYIYLVM